jgi:hypothetical protein
MSGQLLVAGESYFIASDEGDPAEVNVGSGDVIFSKNWTRQQAAEWREANLTPGPEWPPIRS